MAQQRMPMYMNDWIKRLDAILQLNGREILTHAGKNSHKEALEKSSTEYEAYKKQQKQTEYLKNVEELEQDIKQLGKKLKHIK
jgi:hypothetical protein